MAATVEPRTRHLYRSEGDRVLFGVAGGIGERIGIDPLVVRLGFVLLTLAGGVGVVCYLAGLVVSREPPDGDVGTHSPSGRRTVGVVLVLAGVLLLLRSFGLWLGDGVVVPASLVVFGSIVLWTRATLGRSRLARWLARGSTGTVRLVAGVVLIAIGILVFTLVGRRSGLLLNAPVAAVAAIAIVALVLGPWVIRLARQGRLDRRERIRSEERATLAAHLHDSVLQTLALIQRAEDPRRMSSLARTQERELRAWLYGRRPPEDPSSVAIELEAIVDQVERAHGVPVESVIVGDAPVDDKIAAMLAAAREALVNAARHSGARSVSLFAEIEPQRISVYVRDQGSGFDRAAVPPDRRGIADSIEGRMERVGGGSVIATDVGAGTEVRLELERGPST